MAIAERLDRHFSVRTFALALTGLVILMAAGIAICGMTGKVDIQPGIGIAVAIQKAGNTSVQSGELRPDDVQLTPATAKAPDMADQPVGTLEDAVAGLHETTPYGLVPVIRASDKLTAFQAYHAPFTAAPTSKGLISLVMVDYGLSKAVSEQAMKIPGLTYAISPYLKSAQTAVNAARAAKSEVWVSLPVQTPSYPATDSGANTLLADLTAEENQKRLLKSLAVATGYVGIINPGAIFDFAAYKTLIGNRGLATVDAAGTELWIDEDLTPETVKARLAALEQAALKNKSAVAYFHPYPALLTQLQSWMASLPNKSLQLAPLSAVVQPLK